MKQTKKQLKQEYECGILTLTKKEIKTLLEIVALYDYEERIVIKNIDRSEYYDYNSTCDDTFCGCQSRVKTETSLGFAFNIIDKKYKTIVPCYGRILDNYDINISMMLHSECVLDLHNICKYIETIKKYCEE